MKEKSYVADKTFFSSTCDLEKIINIDKNYTLMVNFGEYGLENFSECKNKNIKIRVAFKKHNQKDALMYIKSLVDLNWDVFVNPMSTNTYTEQELYSLILELNKIRPFGLTIVDTLGNMYEKDVLHIFEYIDKILDSRIALGFHSHNSMQLSFSNTKALLKKGIQRLVIIDSCLYGMGRGAGNLCTELIAKYLNDNLNKEYSILPLLKTIDEKLKPIYQETPWGYSTPYYIAAIHGCHPNYAAYLVKNNLPDEKIDYILSNIPDDKKTVFDENFINIELRYV